MMNSNCLVLCIVLFIATQSTNDSIPVGASRPAGVPVPGQSTRGGERPQPPAVGDPDYLPPGASRPACVPVPGQSTRGGERPQPPAVGDPDYLPPGGPDGVQEGQGDNAGNSN